MGGRCYNCVYADTTWWATKVSFGPKSGVLRDQMCTTQGRKVDCVRQVGCFERAVLHRVLWCMYATAVCKVYLYHGVFLHSGGPGARLGMGFRALLRLVV